MCQWCVPTLLQCPKVAKMGTKCVWGRLEKNSFCVIMRSTSITQKHLIDMRASPVSTRLSVTLQAKWSCRVQLPWITECDDQVSDWKCSDWKAHFNVHTLHPNEGGSVEAGKHRDEIHIWMKNVNHIGFLIKCVVFIYIKLPYSLQHLLARFPVWRGHTTWITFKS